MPALFRPVLNTRLPAFPFIPAAPALPAPSSLLRLLPSSLLRLFPSPLLRLAPLLFAPPGDSNCYLKICNKTSIKP